MTNDYGIRAFQQKFKQLLHIVEPGCRLQLHYLSRGNFMDYYLTVPYWLDEVT